MIGESMDAVRKMDNMVCMEIICAHLQTMKDIHEKIMECYSDVMVQSNLDDMDDLDKTINKLLDDLLFTITYDRAEIGNRLARDCDDSKKEKE